MKKYALHLLVIAVGVASLGGFRVAYAFAVRDARSDYRVLEPDLYHPTFFTRYAIARQHGASWLRSAAMVAFRYVGYTRVCPTQQILRLVEGKDRMTFVITRSCPYSAATVKEFRVELVERDGFWEIEWAGLRLKCATNQSRIGAYMIAHNPFQASNAPWASSMNNAVRSFAKSLNPWLPECP
jgi:hypothetical protein